MASLLPGTLEAIRATPLVLRALLSGLPEELTATAGPEGWSPGDVVAHLVVAGRLGALDRASRALTEERPALAGYDEEGELVASGLRGEAVERLIGLLEAERERCVALRGVPSDEALARVGEHVEVGDVTVAELLHQAAYHDGLHLAQIASLVSSSFVSGRGGLAGAQS